MTFNSSLSLFISIVILALIPSVSVLAVSVRAVTYGFRHGFLTTIGIVSGDIIFILLAIYGLTFLREIPTNLLTIFKLIGGGYLIWLGIGLWRTKNQEITLNIHSKSSFLSSFLIGFFISLGDLKAIFFYLSFLPAFVDLSTISITDTFVIILMATIGVGGAKLIYALMGDKTSSLLKKTKMMKVINSIAGTLIISIGVMLIFQ
ncbi:LysE family translocator [Geminocystis sp. CENA526]|uniref:LysE family translocator n=1 Tax=Geminocystis sp. CENA526 TaxID=1355871 RepID=UPI003D6F3327